VHLRLTRTAQYSTSDATSFAHTSARARWPIILTQAIDDVHRSTHATTDEAKLGEGKWIVAELAKLKYELQHDRELTPLADDGGRDIAAYNAELAARGSPKWHSVAWLYAECYLYRCVRQEAERGPADGHCQAHVEHLQADRAMGRL
jgi:hypothetical protein